MQLLPGIFLAVAGHAAVATSALGQLPLPSGPYPVGTTTFHWIDSSRVDPVSGTWREIAAQVWYPAESVLGGPPAMYHPHLDTFLAGLKSDTIPEIRAWHSRVAGFAGVRTRALDGAPLADRAAPFPVLLFSPGGNMSRHWHTAFNQEQASHGYFVLAMSHAHSGWDVFPLSGFVRGADRWVTGETPDQRVRLDEELADLLAGDARFVLDQLTGANQTSSSAFSNRFDLDRIAILGHSRGGTTVGRTCSTDPRVRACIVFDNIGPQRERTSGLAQPQLTIRATWPEPRVERLRSYLRRNRTAAYDVEIAGANHYSFTDLPFLDPGIDPAPLAPARVHEIVSALTRAFLDRHLHGKPTTMSSLAARMPEVTMTPLVGP